MKKQMPAKPAPDRRNRVVSFLVISVILHILLALFVVIKNETDVWEKLAQRDKIDPSVQFLDLAQMDALMPGKMVEQDKKVNKQKPKDSKFVSEKDNTVEKETRAARHGEFQNKKNQNESNAQNSQQKQAAASATMIAPNSPETMKTFEGGDFAVPQHKDEKIIVKKAKSFADLRHDPVADIAQTAMASVSQTNDHLTDVAAGAETQLNTREFLYYTYFNRIKRQLRQHWEPAVHEKVRKIAKRGRDISQLSGAKTTRLIIVLDDHGGLSRIQVATTSGLEDLDDAALEALRKAAPFPNPPKDLVKEGFVRINWDFILES